MKSDINIKRVSGYDSYGNATYSFQGTIKGRIEYKNRLIKDAKGQEVVSSGTIRTLESLNPADIVEGYQVITCTPQTDLNGKFQFNVVFF